MLTRPTLLGRSILFATLVGATCVYAADSDRPDKRFEQLQARHRELHATFASELEEIAAFCDEKGLADAAADVRSRSEQRDADALQSAPLPDHVQPDIPRGASADERHWRVQLRHVEQDYARELYSLSRNLLHAGYPSHAYDLVREVARHDPDHQHARRLLGMIRVGDAWVTPFEGEMRRQNKVWDDRFGWILQSDLPRYEQGERKIGARWMGAAQEAEIRRDFRHAWEIRTEHFLVKTNHSLERGVEIARKLEQFHGFFVQTFAAFFNTPEQMRQLFEGRGSRSSRGNLGDPMEVHYYRTREEYVSRLQKRIPLIEQTNGLYYTSDRISYFYFDAEADLDTTLYHEATHQMFYESAARHRQVAGDAHFWIIEGIACYMESFKDEGDTLSLGDPMCERFRAARYRYLVDNYYVPLEQFARMGMTQFQTHPKIATNYSQASGLAQFFMHFDHGRYRDALIEHLAQLYRHRGSSARASELEGLDQLTGVPYADLDVQYGEFINAIENRLAAAGAVAE